MNKNSPYENPTGVLAIAVAESIFWALGVPLAAIYYKYTTGEAAFVFYYSINQWIYLKSLIRIFSGRKKM